MRSVHTYTDLLFRITPCFPFVTTRQTHVGTDVHTAMFLTVAKCLSFSRCSYGTSGCESGLPEQAFEYVVQSRGLATAADYAYYGGDWQPCRSPPALASLATWRYTTRGSEPELQYVLAAVGPVAARMDADHTSFQLYQGGVYDHLHCSTTKLNLAVQIVGFGTELVYGQEVPYWLAKNAWGAGWGEYGYIKIHKDAQNMCGIATDVTYPVVG